MSSRAHHALLLEAVERLQETIAADIKDRGQAGIDFSVTCRLVADYIREYGMLEECYDQIVHTQRRITIRSVLVRTITRMLGLYWKLTRPTELVEGQTASVWRELAANILSQSQSIGLEIPAPRIVKDDTGPAYAHREELFAKDLKQFEEARAAREASMPPAMSLEEACVIVQRAERARHARHETLIKRGVQIQQATLSHPKKLAKDDGDRERNSQVIKNFWLKFGKRHRERARREKEKVLIGMKKLERDPKLEESVNRTMTRRKEEAKKRSEELTEAKGVHRIWLEDNREVDLERKLNELNAEFYNETKMTTGKAPAVKPKTNVLLTLMGRVEEPPDEELSTYVTEQSQKKGKKKKDAPKKEAPKPSGGGKKDAVIPTPQQVIDLQESMEAFNELWNREDQPPATDDFDVLLVRKEMWTAMVPEIAVKCELNLKTELKNLKILEMRRVRKARQPRQRKKRQRKVRDPLNGKSDEELLAQLVGLGIACPNPTTTFKDFVGHFDFTNPVDFTSPDPEGAGPSYASIRSQMMLEAVMPFAADRERMTDIPKGVLVTGNKGTGKSLLARAAINALGATFLNFSPSVLVGKETPTPRILVFMLIKAARILAPSVILIDDIDRMFGRGKKSDASKKFKMQLRKQIRKVKPRDRILLIGTTSQFPLPKPCTTLFNRCVDIPKPNFATRVSIWEYWLAKKGLVLPTVSINALAFASDQYTGGSIARCCVRAHRVKTSRTEPSDPITDREIISFLREAPEEESKPQVPFNFNGFAPKPVMAKKS